MPNKTGLKCPFCDEFVESDSYFVNKGFNRQFELYCPNDKCPVRPSTGPMKLFSLAIEDYEAWGRKIDESKENVSCTAG